MNFGEKKKKSESYVSLSLDIGKGKKRGEGKNAVCIKGSRLGGEGSIILLVWTRQERKGGVAPRKFVCNSRQGGRKTRPC